MQSVGMAFYPMHIPVGRVMRSFRPTHDFGIANSRIGWIVRLFAVDARIGPTGGLGTEDSGRNVHLMQALPLIGLTETDAGARGGRGIVAACTALVPIPTSSRCLAA